MQKVNDQIEAVRFYNPITTTIIHVDNRVQRLEDKTFVYTKDVQQAEITYVVNYSLDQRYSAKVFSEVGIGWEDKLIPQVIYGSMKNVIGKWAAIELVSNRDKATVAIQQEIANSLAAYGIRITKVELVNIDFADEFERAVEAKVVAVQRAEESKNATVRVEEEAKQRIIAADADAKAMTIKTAALKESQSLVFYEAIQKWNGVLPKIISGDGGMMLNVSKDMVQ